MGNFASVIWRKIGYIFIAYFCYYNKISIIRCEPGNKRNIQLINTARRSFCDGISYSKFKQRVSDTDNTWIISMPGKRGLQRFLADSNLKFLKEL